MQPTLVIHILAGGLALVSGFAALFAAKGGRLHRKSGMLFVYAMLTMSLLGALIARATRLSSQFQCWCRSSPCCIGYGASAPDGANSPEGLKGVFSTREATH